MSTITAAPRSQNTWDIDLSHSSLGFSVRHLVISKVQGRFARWSGSLHLDDVNPGNSRVEVTIEAASIDTHEPQRDAHLRSADFLDTDKHPQLTFRSTRIEKAGAGRFQLAGDLTIAGVTRPVQIDVEPLGRTKDPWGGERAGFSAKTSIDRRDFGLVWNQALEAGGVVVGEKIEIAIEVEAVKRAEQPAAQAAAPGAGVRAAAAILAALLLTAGTAGAQTRLAKYEAQEKTVKAHIVTFDELDFDVFTHQKWDRLKESHSKDVIVHWPDGHATHGIEKHIEDLKAMFVYAPDTRIQVHPVKFGSGEWTSVIGEMEGTFTKPMPTPDGKEIQPTGKPFKITMSTVGHWKNGVMDEEYLFWDNQTYMRMIGLGH